MARLFWSFPHSAAYWPLPTLLNAMSTSKSKAVSIVTLAVFNSKPDSASTLKDYVFLRIFFLQNGGFYPVTCARVRLVCRDIVTEQVKYEAEALTDKNGKYTIAVVGDHENELCDVEVVKSPREDCKDPAIGFENSRVVCSGNVGMHNPIQIMQTHFSL
ncbi:hypothetical protein HAX54_045039 [Datura stramonium]|uniref:Uncharacterized protein n=1 Tax=Datura stramonium TaxID=4076 RepID=A0ABS8WJC3_DATST|nr:hypothetical protein [Datura stramonium]